MGQLERAKIQDQLSDEPHLKSKYHSWSNPKRVQGCWSTPAAGVGLQVSGVCLPWCQQLEIAEIQGQLVDNLYLSHSSH